MLHSLRTTRVVFARATYRLLTLGSICPGARRRGTSGWGVIPAIFKRETSLAGMTIKNFFASTLEIALADPCARHARSDTYP
jgi:hypothetical protein